MSITELEKVPFPTDLHTFWKDCETRLMQHIQNDVSQSNLKSYIDEISNNITFNSVNDGNNNLLIDVVNKINSVLAGNKLTSLDIKDNTTTIFCEKAPYILTLFENVIVFHTENNPKVDIELQMRMTPWGNSCVRFIQVHHSDDNNELMRNLEFYVIICTLLYSVVEFCNTMRQKHSEMHDAKFMHDSKHDAKFNENFVRTYDGC